MRVFAINGSPRANGNTSALIQIVLDELTTEGIECELFQIGGLPVRGCTACYKCFQQRNQRCAIQQDVINHCIEQILASDGVIIGSPTYFANVNAEIKALIDRVGLVARANGDMFKRKVGAAVVAVRRAGAIHAFNSINHLFTIGQMIIPGSSYWNLGIGGAPNDVQGDEEGIQTMKTLGQNMAWLLKKIHDHN
jgi:multimeric flavodoxin WrbA